MTTTPLRRQAGRPPTFITLALMLAATSVSGTEVIHETAIRYPHVWRGIALRSFPILTASSTVTLGRGWSANVWVGLDLADGDQRAGEVQEIDVELRYRRAWPRLALEAGLVGLIFPGGIDPTGEAFVHLTVPGTLTTRLELFYNVDLLRDGFALLHLERRWTLAPRWHLDVRGTVGYSGREYARFFDGRAGGWHHAGATLDLAYGHAGRSWTLRLAYTDTLDRDVLPRQPDRLWFGVYFRWQHGRPGRWQNHR